MTRAESSDPVQQKSTAFGLEVAAGQWKAAALRGLPQGGNLAIDLHADGPVGFFLLDERNYAAFPDAARALFEGETGDEFGFSLVLPETGDYFLVVDNREGAAARRVSLRVTAAAGPGTERGGVDEVELANAMLAGLVTGLQEIFIAPGLELRTERCAEGPAGERRGVVVCLEYVMTVLDTFQDLEQASAVLQFALMREVARYLLGEWRHPLRDEPDTIDEFATAVAVMLGQKERTDRQSSLFATLAPGHEWAARLTPDPAQPMTPERASRILDWLDDDDLVRRWQPVIVPHLQSALLERLRAAPMAWTVPELVERELAERKRASGDG